MGEGVEEQISATQAFPPPTHHTTTAPDPPPLRPPEHLATPLLYLLQIQQAGFTSYP